MKRDLDREDGGAGSSGDEDGETDGWSSGDEDGEGGEDDEGEGESRPRPGGAGRESRLLSGLRAGKGSLTPLILCLYLYVSGGGGKRER